VSRAARWRVCTESPIVRNPYPSRTGFAPPLASPIGLGTPAGGHGDPGAPPSCAGAGHTLRAGAADSPAHGNAHRSTFALDHTTGRSRRAIGNDDTIAGETRPRPGLFLPGVPGQIRPNVRPRSQRRASRIARTYSRVRSSSSGPSSLSLFLGGGRPPTTTPLRDLANSRRTVQNSALSRDQRH
jgi:hypothetical protein